MNTLFHRDGEHDDDSEPLRGRNQDHQHERSDRNQHGDREITLGTTLVLGIFFALAVLCAVFFGFGYTVGARRVVAHAAAAGTDPATANPAATSTFNGFKPAPGSPAASTPAKHPSDAITVPYPPPAAPTRTAVSSRALPAESPESEPATTAAAKLPARAVPPSPPPAVAPIPAPVTAPQPVVQIAAVSHQEDADLLVSTLKRRGYSVVVRQEGQDKLLHVQVGPFASRKDADLMRQRLLADGFNAIVK